MSRMPSGVKGKTIKSGQAKRSWLISLGLALAIIGVGVALSAVISPLFGRYVHWDWMAGAAPAALALRTLAIHRRWAF